MLDFMKLVCVIKWWRVKLFPNFTSIPFDYLLISWVTNYVSNGRGQNMAQGSMDNFDGPGPWTVFKIMRNEQKIRLKTTTTTTKNNARLISNIKLCLHSVNTRLLPHAKMLLVLINCVLWRVDYALEENLNLSIFCCLQWNLY